MRNIIIYISFFGLISCFNYDAINPLNTSEEYVCCEKDCCETAKVHLLIGESTAAGRGDQDSVYYGGFPNVEIWQDKSGTSNDEFEVLQLSNNMGTTLASTDFFGAEMEFAKLIQEQSQCCPTYIIKYGRGGRKLCDYWLNGGAGEGLVANGISAAIADVKSQHENVVVESVYWWQGINDSNDQTCADDYYTNGIQFINNVNTSLGQSPKWIMVRNHDELDSHPFNSTVQSKQDDLFNAGYVDVLTDGNIFEVSSDNVHYTAQGNIDKGIEWFNNL